jgi:predicted MarR family transcription regulator
MCVRSLNFVRYATLFDILFRINIMPRHPTKIVSSEHLVSETSAELSEFEYGLIMAGNAFNRWMVRCMLAAGAKDMTAVEVSLLHHVSHRDRKKKIADICFVLNIEDTHVASYALKKLMARGYVASEKVGKEVFFSATPAGRELCGKYREVRESCLISTLKESGLTNEQIGEAAQLLRNASGLYDTAARAAASL